MKDFPTFQPSNQIRGSDETADFRLRAIQRPGNYPSREVAAALAGRGIPGAELHSLVLPVDAERAPRQLLEFVDEWKPGVVVCLGEAGGRARISIERVAVNLLDFRIPDNAAQQPVDQPAVDDAPDAYFQHAAHTRDVRSRGRCRRACRAVDDGRDVPLQSGELLRAASHRDRPGCAAAPASFTCRSCPSRPPASIGPCPPWRLRQWFGVLKRV